MKTCLSLLALACAVGSTRAASAFELRLDAFEPKTPSFSLLEAPDAIPASMRAAVAGDVADELSLNAGSFVADLEANAAAREDLVAGGGQVVAPENAWLAFVLGLIPGFGLGHFLIAGRPAAGTRWLIIDIVFLVVWIVVDAVLGSIAWGYGGWGLWWLVADLLLPVGWIVEHIFQGLSAYRDATGRSMFGQREPSEHGSDDVADRGLRMFPNLATVRF
ncbi:MAG TPA: hypothetical protein VMB50_21030 [Myxococcales bacterium]|nr:hypothetical protein [Myxococcales bacterium]